MDESYLSWLRLIPGVSPHLAKRIAERYPDPALLKGATTADLGNIQGMTGEVAARVLELVRAAATADASWYREEPALYLCPECGSFVGKGSTACPFCGVVFDEGETTATPSPVEELLQARNGEAKICTRCGAFLEPGATACGMCGSVYTPERVAGLPAVDTTPLPDPDLFLCPHCGAFLSQADAACAICGSPVDAASRIPGLAREGRGVSKDFLSRWQRVTSDVTTPATVAPEPQTLEDELAEYERILDADPSLPRAWVHKGRLLARLGRTEDAISSFDRAARIDPENEDLYRVEALGLLGPAPDLSALPPRWKPAAVVDELDLDLEDAPRPPPAPAPKVPPTVTPAIAPVSQPRVERAAPKKVAPAVEPASPPPIAREAAAIRRALAYYDRLLAMDSGLRVAWQTKGELLLRLGRKGDADAAFQRATDLEVAEREFGRAALTGLQTRGPTRPVPAQGTAPAGRTNGRVNGLTNGRRGRTNGRVNGLTNGSGATNVLTNGFGRVNGLMSGLARGEGRTNGLVNGNGFTNGRRGRPAGPLPSAGREWARSLAGIAAVVLLMVIAPILASMFTTTPAATGIVIDGSFGDWNAVSILYSDPVGDTRGNPGVDLTGYKLQADGFGLFAYARVNGVAFLGAGNGTDLLVALIDKDNDSATGYDAGPIGADYAVEVYGWDGAVRDAPLLKWAGSDRTDWTGFRNIGSARAMASGSEVEFYVDAPSLTNARVRFAAMDSAGGLDEGDAVVTPMAPALVVEETAIAPDVILSPTGVPVLRLDLRPSGLPVIVTSVSVSKRGSLADADIALRLHVDNGDGVYSTADPVLSTGAPTQGLATFPVSLTITVPTTLFVVADLAVLPANGTFGLGFAGARTAAGTVTLAVREGRMSYLAAAPGPTVDGAFADWQGIRRTTDPIGDVVNRTGSGILPVLNANVDLSEVAANLSTNLSLYVRVDGSILGGIDVQNLRGRPPALTAVDSDSDSVPDNVEFALGTGLPYDFNNDNTSDANAGGDLDSDGIVDYPTGPDYYLNTTIPAWYPAPYAGRSVARYIGPVSLPPQRGVDTVYAYIDRDNRTTTGLYMTVAGVPYGMDYAYQAVGRNGTILEAALYAANTSLAIPWVKVADVPTATDTHRLEAAINASLVNLSTDHSLVFITSDWRASYDIAGSGAWSRSMPAPGTRSTTGGGPQPLDIVGNRKYYLRNTNHATETACAVNKVASTTPGAGPAAQVTLTPGQSACWYADQTQGTTIPAGDWEVLLDLFLAHGLVMYGENGFGNPRVREWTGSAFGAETSGTAVPGNEQWVVIAASPTGPERVVGVLSDDNRLYVQTWNGAAWTANWDVGVTASDTRKFDLAYEGMSGDVVLAFGDGTNQLKYRRRIAGTWDGANLNAGTSLGATPRWVRTVARPTNDDVFIGALTSAETVHAMRWDGATNTLGSQVQMSQITRTSTQEPFDITFERASGDAFVIWGTTFASLRYREYTSAWQPEVVAYTLPDDPRWVLADADPRATSNAIAVGMILDNTNFEFGGWDGTAWVAPPAAVAARSEQNRGIDVAFESGTGRAMYAFDTAANPTQFTWRTWTPGVGFSGVTVAAGTVGNLRFLQLRSNPYRPEIMLMQSDDNSDLFYRRWFGGAWSAATAALETTMSASNRRESFMFSWTRVVEYDVLFEIWNVATNTVVRTIGSCLDQRTYGNDTRCAVTGVPQVVLGPNEVVRVRIAHSSLGGSVSIVFDDVLTSGDSRMTIPIPEFETVIVPIAVVVVLVAVRRMRRGKKTE